MDLTQIDKQLFNNLFLRTLFYIPKDNVPMEIKEKLIENPEFLQFFNTIAFIENNGNIYSLQDTSKLF